MVALKPRHLRNRTEDHIPMSLIGFLKTQATAQMHTPNKVILDATDGRKLRFEPLYLSMASVADVATQLNLYFTREELIQKDKEILEVQKLLKEVTTDLLRKGDAAMLEGFLQRAAKGEIKIEDLRKMKEELFKKEEINETDGNNTTQA